MKICIAQTRPIPGNIQANIENHIKLIGLAVENGSSIIIFPELSLTGYEPKLAKKLATSPRDTRFNQFQNISNSMAIIIGVGIPIKKDQSICISMVLFKPHLPRQTYSKKYLHPDEHEYFVSGNDSGILLVENSKISLAICYELSVPEHAINAINSGAGIYIASVAKHKSGVEKAHKKLSNIAAKYSIHVLMSNSIGSAEGFDCAGKSAIWNSKGRMIEQLNDSKEGLLILDISEKEQSVTNLFYT